MAAAPPQVATLRPQPPHRHELSRDRVERQIRHMAADRAHLGIERAGRRERGAAVVRERDDDSNEKPSGKVLSRQEELAREISKKMAKAAKEGGDW